MLNEWCSSNNVVKDIKWYSNLQTAPGSPVSNRKICVNSNNYFIFVRHLNYTSLWKSHKFEAPSNGWVMQICSFKVVLWWPFRNEMFGSFRRCMLSFFEKLSNGLPRGVAPFYLLTSSLESPCSSTSLPTLDMATLFNFI